MADLDGRDVRDDVLRRLRWLGPRLLVLSEPNLHSHERDFYTRFRLCFSHFEVVFAAIDALPVQDRDKNALKVCFFGREIVDMLGRPEGRRTERHESTSSWLRRLDASGWEARFDASVPARSDSGVEVRARGTHASIEFGGEPIISVLCATPRDGEALREAPEGVGRGGVVDGGRALLGARPVRGRADGGGHVAGAVEVHADVDAARGLGGSAEAREGLAVQLGEGGGRGLCAHGQKGMSQWHPFVPSQGRPWRARMHRSWPGEASGSRGASTNTSAASASASTS